MYLIIIKLIKYIELLDTLNNNHKNKNIKMYLNTKKNNMFQGYTF